MAQLASLLTSALLDFKVQIAKSISGQYEEVFAEDP
jgi:hypothetical protein